MAPPGWSQGLAWGVGEGRDQLSEGEGGVCTPVAKKWRSSGRIGLPFFSLTFISLVGDSQA